MAPAANLRCGEASPKPHKDAGHQTGLIQKIGCLAVLFHELARDPDHDFCLEPSSTIPGGEECKTHFMGPGLFPKQRTYILSRHES